MGEYDRVEFRDSGEPVTRRQRQALLAVERYIRRRRPWWNFRWQMPQGSWQQETSYSGTTHTDRGVADLVYSGISDNSRRGKRKYRYVLKATREVGRQAAFGRGPWCDMPYHFHVCDLDTTGMDANAAWQVAEYRRGNDGLVAGRDDPFPFRPDPIRSWHYQP
jgi:hypothetical protein